MVQPGALCTKCFVKRAALFFGNKEHRLISMKYLSRTRSSRPCAPLSATFKNLFKHPPIFLPLPIHRVQSHLVNMIKDANFNQLRFVYTSRAVLTHKHLLPPSLVDSPTLVDSIALDVVVEATLEIQPTNDTS